MGVSSIPPSLHRYLYAYSNPTVYVDLYGNNPNKSEALNLEGNYRGEESYVEWLYSLDLNSLTTRKQLHKLGKEQYDLHLINDSPSYLYSKDFWWIDMRHFMNSAQSAFEVKNLAQITDEEKSGETAIKTTLLFPLIGGIPIEQNQARAAIFQNDERLQNTWYGEFIKDHIPVATEGSSAFTVEDLPVIFQNPIILCAELAVIRFRSFLEVLPNYHGLLEKTAKVDPSGFFGPYFIDV